MPEPKTPSEATIPNDTQAEAQSQTVEKLQRRIRLLSRRLERAENETSDLRRSGVVGESAPASNLEADLLRLRIDELENSTSWRVTRYLRAAKDLSSRVPLRLRGGVPVRRAVTATPEAPAPVQHEGEHRPGRVFSYLSREVDELLLESRLVTVLGALHLTVNDSDQTTVLTPEQRLIATPPTGRDAWWLITVGYLGALPTELQLDRTIDDLFTGGAELAIARLRALRAEQTGRWQVTAPIRIISTPVVEVTFTASTSLHTGVQRVVRNVVPGWLGRATPLVLDHEARAWRMPTAVELSRVVDVNDLPTTGADPTLQGELPSEVVVPWQTTVVVPELKPPVDLELMRCAAQASANTFSAIVYDAIPVLASEFVPPEVTSGFGPYISMLKYFDRVSAISDSSADEFSGLARGFVAQGLHGPAVRTHRLPLVSAPAALASPAAAVAGLRQNPSVPLVLQVGSIGLHKNQRSTLSAAASLWAGGLEFELLFVAPNSWSQQAFIEQLSLQRQLGRPVSALNNVSEDELWSLYREARVVVMPSFVEGYGLPVAESLSVGTPVITSSFGSMAEIAENGGALTVSPHDVAALARALSDMISDDDAYQQLKSEAQNVQLSSWKDYADETWSWLVGGEDE